MPIWLASLKKHARCNSHPRKLVREIHQLEPPSKPPQLSPCRVFVRLGERIRHHPEGSIAGGGLGCREAERTVSGAGGRSRRHVLHRSKEPRKACHQSRRRDGSTAGKRWGPVVFHSSVSPQHHASPEKTTASESHCGGSTWEHSEQIGPV